MPSVLTQPVPHDEAAKFIADKPVMAREVFDQLVPDLRARAFVITGVENANVVQAVRDRIAELPKGADWDKLKEDIAGRISPWFAPDAGAKDADGNPLTGTARDAAAMAAGEKRAELLLRTHGYQAYQAAQFEVMDRQRAAFPYWQYQTAEDDHVRDTHAALDGLVLPADSDFWATHFPPWDFGCRCFIAPLTADDVTDIQAQDADKKPEEQRVLDGDRLRQLEQVGELRRALPGDNGLPRQLDMRAPEQKGGTYRFDPASLKMGAEQLQPRYDAETWTHFEKWAKAQPLSATNAGAGNVWEWMNQPPARAATGARTPRVEKVKPAPAPAAAPVVAPKPAAPDLQLVGSTIENQRQSMQLALYKTETPMGSGVNAAVKLTNGKTVIFKAGDAEYGTQLRRGIKPGTQYLREVASSIIDEEMKLGLVPPTTLIKRDGREGSAQLFKDGFKTAGATRNVHKVIAELPDRIKHDWQLFDDLVNHLDRHGGNFLLRVKDGQTELALIDNGLSLSTVAQRKAYSGPLEKKPIDETNRARLADLIAREAQITERLKPYLERGAVQDFFSRARTLLERGTYGDTYA